MTSSLQNRHAWTPATMHQVTGSWYLPSLLREVSLESIHIRDLYIFCKQYIKKHWTYTNFKLMILNLDDDRKRDSATL